MSVCNCLPAYAAGSPLTNPPALGVPVPGLPPSGLAESNVYTTQPVVCPSTFAAPPCGEATPLPSWLARITSAFAGNPLMVSGRLFLKYFANRCSGPMWWDAALRRMSVGWPSKCQHLAASGYVARGYLPLATYTEKTLDVEGQADPQVVGVFEHGVQQIQDASSGKLMALDIDPITSTVRIDNLIPVVTANANVPTTGAKVLGYYLTTETLSNGAQKEVVNWIAVDLSSILSRLAALEAA